ncbi:hypothetical protein P3S68_015599 [Capsicum galapagoense]
MTHILILIVQDGLKEIDASIKRITQMVKWNSTYLMLDTTQHFETAFNRYDLEDSGLSTYLATNVCEDESVAGVLKNYDWQSMRNVVIFLKRFYDLTVKVSGALYVTSNVYLKT